MRKAKYIVFEGTEGCGKSTYTKMLVDHLTSQGFKVLQTKEPGTPLLPITMKLRGLMLDAQHDLELTVTARELISQAIRSIHIEKLIVPALAEYDYIVQDRGILSGLAYGHACGNTYGFLGRMTDQVVLPTGGDETSLYNKIVYLKADSTLGLARAQQTKQEFAAGDAIEAKGAAFMRLVARLMDEMVKGFPHCTINIGNKTIEETFQEILLNIG